ncbi:putative tRNA (cytidine(32)/guanosine(34)-2'-O)-methyltransferase [Astathelohania contejeani]|uniref:tRNA (Cytidine(32)/guanosine(34)-2'-O)-methyltransferase n=1 Tax=Astathelohania contejeani TaxID=164912 RepID=A0ABQ7HVK7_9MICR|nr:putative tRNA (cytidine(32)/guanosine(34)-2'-O)-methyltransferase [Thelohania contejeani]
MGISSKDKRDIYYRLAKKMGYRARSAFKLIHIDESYNIFDGISNIVDLCAAPGSWSQVVMEKCPHAKLVSVDLQEMVPIEGATCLKEDITSDICTKKINNIFGDKKVELVLCDGAPDITGLHDLDEYFQTELVLSALSITQKIGREGCSFIAKCFRSDQTGYLRDHFKSFFDDVMFLKPRSSRSASVECFIYGKSMNNFTGNPLTFENNYICEPVRLYSCGSGPDPDLTYLTNESSEDPKYLPISPPYKKAIEMRRK